MMILKYSQRFLRSYAEAPATIQQAFDKQAALLAQNPRHPSLRCKKYDESKNIWQARVNRNWRFYFQIEDSFYILLDIIPHPK